MRALVGKERRRLEVTNRAANSRLALVEILRKAKVEVSLVTVRNWSRARQGQAYLWAYARLLGREDVPRPEWMR